uniref:Uncharacterized protein n=1 Tax=Anguilla anguilla TaxID=7936 RepID=A0A0E9UGN1_ANGAN
MTIIRHYDYISLRCLQVILLPNTNSRTLIANNNNPYTWAY